MASRKGSRRRRACAVVRASQPRCWLCGFRIDLTLDRQRHPLGSTIDEVVPVSMGGSTTDPANLRHAHRWCNSWRRERLVTDELRAELLAAMRAAGLLRGQRVSGPSRRW